MSNIINGDLVDYISPNNCPHYEVRADYIELVRRYSLMLGALKGLRWQVPDDVRQRIDSVISEVEAETK